MHRQDSSPLDGERKCHHLSVCQYGLCRHFSTLREDCAEFMVAGLTSLENSGGYLLDEHGSPTAEKTTLHGEARDFVYEFIMDKLINIVK